MQNNINGYVDIIDKIKVKQSLGYIYEIDVKLFNIQIFALSDEKNQRLISFYYPSNNFPHIDTKIGKKIAIALEFCQKCELETQRN